MPKAPSRKSVFWFFAIPTAAVLLLLGGYLARIFYYQHQIEAAREALRTDGAPMSFAELAVGPPVPDEENAALVVNELSRRYENQKLREALYVWETDDESQPDWLFSWDRLDAQQQAELAAWLGQKEIRQILTLIKSASLKPAWDSTDAPDAYAGRPEQNRLIFQHLIFLTVLEANRIAGEALAAKTPEARVAATEEAYGWLLVGLNLADLMAADRREVGIIKCVLGMVARSVIADNMVELDRKLSLPLSQRRLLLARLREWDWQNLWPRMIDADRVDFADEIEYYGLSRVAMGYSDAPQLGTWERGNEIIGKVYGYVAIPDFLRRYAVFLNYQRQFRELSPADWGRVQQLKPVYAAALRIPVEDLRLGLGPSLIWYDRLSVILVTHELAATGLAINAYADDHDDLPPTLEALVPDYLPELPIDPFADNSAGFHYVREGEQFRLWALGSDGEDNGGTYDSENWQEGDLVFRGRRAVWTERGKENL